MRFFQKIFSSSKKRNETLKAIAIVSMAIDHVGIGFFPGVLIFRIIGRIAMPVFAYSIAEGYHYTSDLKKYIIRLLTFGLIAQIPFFLYIRAMELNIIFTLAFSLYFIYFTDKKKYLWAVLVLALVYIMPIEYGIYGILTTWIFYKFRGQEISLLLAQSMLLLVNFLFSLVVVQLFALLGILVILYFPKEKFKIYLDKQFFYWFYPVHLLILFFIRLVFF